MLEASKAFLDETYPITWITDVKLEDQRPQSDRYQRMLASSRDQVSSVVEWSMAELVRLFLHFTVPAGLER